MSKSRSLGGYLLIGAVLLVAFIVGSQLVMIWRSNARLSAKLAKLRAEGEPTTLAELNPPPIPAEANAAVHLSRISADLEAFDKEFYGQFESTELGKAWIKRRDQGELPTPEQLTAIKAFLAARPNILPALRRATVCETYASLQDFTQQSAITSKYLSGVQHIRALANFVSTEMTVLTAEGKHDDALRLGIDLLRLTRHTDREPFMVAYLVSLAIRGITCNAINDVLQRGPVSSEVSEALDAELARHDPLAQLGEAFRTERVYGMVTLDEEIGGVVGFLHWPKANWQAGLLDLYAEAMELQKLQWFEGQAKLASLQNVADNSGPLSGLMSPALLANYKAANRVAVELRCLRILNSLRAYLRQNDRETTSLDDLALPKQATIDPFSGQPLKFKRTDKGWIVYSVMENGADDGGDFEQLLDWGMAPPGHGYDPLKSQDDEEDAAQESETP